MRFRQRGIVVPRRRVLPPCLAVPRLQTIGRSSSVEPERRSAWDRTRFEHMVTRKDGTDLSHPALWLFSPFLITQALLQYACRRNTPERDLYAESSLAISPTSLRGHSGPFRPRRDPARTTSPPDFFAPALTTPGLFPTSSGSERRNMCDFLRQNGDVQVPRSVHAREAVVGLVGCGRLDVLESENATGLVTGWGRSRTFTTSRARPRCR